MADDQRPPLRTYFGVSDARHESTEQLLANFYESSSSVHGQLKLGDLTGGASIVVAPKGAGKTELRRVIGERAESDGSLVWTIDEDFTRTLANPDRGPAQIKTEITGLLLSGVAAKLVESLPLHKKLPSWVSGLTSLLGRIGRAVDFDAGPIHVDLREVFSDTKPRFDKTPIVEFRKALSDPLADTRCYVLMDDIDEVFGGSYEYPAIVEGVFRAVVDINQAFGDKLHTLAFVKSGLYEAYYRQASAHNEVRDFIEEISWSYDDLVNLLAHRIRTSGSLAPDTKTWRAWSHEFEGIKTEIEAIQEFATRRCNYGPRDMLMLCNIAKRLRGYSKVRISDLVDAESEYCSEKLQLLTGDFGKGYEGIDALIAGVFGGGPTEYSRDAFYALVKKGIKQNKQYADQMPFRTYVKFATEDQLVKLLYDIRAIGFRRELSEETSFGLDQPRPGSKLYSAVTYEIHPAYHTCLDLNVA